MITRHLEATLKKAARQYPVVSLTGPRQSGKTTLVRMAFGKHEYVSLENPEQRAFAHEDPKGFLGQFSGKVILDEAQRAPDLFSYIQGIVDEHQSAGQFILTGSQNFLLLHQISQTLAGRCSMLHLLPFSRTELAGKSMMDVSKIGSSVPGKPSKAGREDLFDMLFKGGYPRIHDKHLAPQDWLRNYYQAYIERDVRELLNVGDIETFGRFVRLCAGRCSQLLNLSSLAGDCGISHRTAQRWLGVLEASFLITLLRPHHGNFNKRLVKSPKLYFLDTGLLCYLLRIRSPEDLRLHASRGAVFESWAISEIIKNYYHRGLEPDVYFWRDSAGHEVDLVIEQGKTLIPVEIKSGETFASDFLKGLDYWRGLAGQENAPAAVVYGGDTSYFRKDVAVMSWRNWE
ncbi:MAG: ATP-binding protein [Phycisphaerae bacterium]|nr:ATP-binding protein [Phycisphaerae bacterium]